MMVAFYHKMVGVIGEACTLQSAYIDKLSPQIESALSLI
jgi:hypothetical protein